jgi:cysteine desulfurase
LLSDRDFVILQMAMIYLDHNATTKPHPEVVEVMTQHWRESFANAGSRYAAGRRARQVLEASRESMASILGADSEELVFTSGGTESNNMALLGLATGPPGTIALTAAEHPAVIETCRFLQTRGWKLEFLPVDSEGLLPPPASANSAGTSTPHSEFRIPNSELPLRLVTVILAHNETGVIQDVASLAVICKARGVPLHVDAAQAVGKIPVNFHGLKVTSLALGARKFQGPGGIGALLIRRGTKLAPASFGGHQEAGRRPGTEAVPLIAGMARALELCTVDLERQMARVRALRDQLEQSLAARCPPVILNGSRERRLPNTLNVSFPGVPGEALLVALDLEGIACSLGSTCASGSAEPSPALVAMNCPREIWQSAVRFSLGVNNTADEIDRAAEIISRVVTRMRSTA